MKRTALTRKTALSSTRAFARSSKLRPMSDKRRAENVVRRAIGQPTRCEIVALMRSSSSEWRWTDADLRCFGSLAWHERRKRSSGGAITNEENLVGACDYHNCWVEDRPLIARALFGTQLVVREGDEEWSRLGARISRKGDS